MAPYSAAIPAIYLNVLYGYSPMVYESAGQPGRGMCTRVMQTIVVCSSLLLQRHNREGDLLSPAQYAGRLSRFSVVQVLKDVHAAVVV